MKDTALLRSSAELLAQDFTDHSELFRVHTAEQPDKIAIADEERAISWGELDALVERIAAKLASAKAARSRSSGRIRLPMARRSWPRSAPEQRQRRSPRPRRPMH
jgi:hypothetical protein